MALVDAQIRSALKAVRDRLSQTLDSELFPFERVLSGTMASYSIRDGYRDSNGQVVHALGMFVIAETRSELDSVQAFLDSWPGFEAKSADAG